MNIEEIKKHKIEAQKQIFNILDRLHKVTGLCPVDVVVENFDSHPIGLESKDREFWLNSVRIRMEGV